MIDRPCRDTRVAIVVPDGIDGHGGIERVMLYLTREWTRQSGGPAFMVQSTRLTSVPLLKHLSTPFALLQFFIRARRFCVDVAHINIAPRGSTYRKMLFAKIARCLGAKVVLHLHGSGYDAFYKSLTPSRKRAVTGFFRSADHVIVLGEYWRNFTSQVLDVDDSKLSVIDNGVPDTGIRADPNKSEAHIVALGVVGERKGTDVLLHALASLPVDVGPWRATIGGNGEIARYSRLSAELGISDLVTFAGWVGEAEVQDLLRSATIFVLPSRAENQPVAILEAMACSLPVISTRVGAIPEQVVEGQTGLLVPPGDPESLAEAIRLVLCDSTIRVSMGQAGHKLFQRRFSVSASAKRVRQVYNNLTRR